MWKARESWNWSIFLSSFEKAELAEVGYSPSPR